MESGGKLSRFHLFPLGQVFINIRGAPSFRTVRKRFAGVLLSRGFVKMSTGWMLLLASRLQMGYQVYEALANWTAGKMTPQLLAVRDRSECLFPLPGGKLLLAQVDQNIIRFPLRFVIKKSQSARAEMKLFFSIPVLLLSNRADPSRPSLRAVSNILQNWIGCVEPIGIIH